MNKQNKRNRSRSAARDQQAAKDRRARAITITVAVLLIVGGAITVVSKQLTSAKASTITSANSQPTKYVTVKVGGRDVQVDPQTGQIKPLSPEEAQHLADGLKSMFNRSTDGLKQVRNGDGSLSMDLEGRFQNVAVARVNTDGSVERSCVDTPEAAANFFGIDPQLLGVEPVNSVPSKAVPRTPARNASQ